MKYIAAAIMFAALTGAAICMILLIGLVNVGWFNWIMSMLMWVRYTGFVFIVPPALIVCSIIVFKK